MSIFYHTQKKTQHLKFVKLMVAVYDHIQRVPARERYTETRIFMSPMIQGLEIEDMFCAHQNKLDLIVNDDKFMKKTFQIGNSQETQTFRHRAEVSKRKKE